MWKILLVSRSWTNSDFIFQEYNKYTHNKIALHWLSTLLKYNTNPFSPPTSVSYLDLDYGGRRLSRGASPPLTPSTFYNWEQQSLQQVLGHPGAWGHLTREAYRRWSFPHATSASPIASLPFTNRDALWWKVNSASCFQYPHNHSHYPQLVTIPESTNVDSLGNQQGFLSAKLRYHERPVQTLINVDAAPMLPLLISHSTVLALMNKNPICPSSSTQGTISSPTQRGHPDFFLAEDHGLGFKDPDSHLSWFPLSREPVQRGQDSQKNHIISENQRPETRSSGHQSRPSQNPDCLEIIFVKIMKRVCANRVLVLH